MFHPSVTVVVPTLAADSALTDCLLSLQAQSSRDFEVIVVDNSGAGSARALLPRGIAAQVIENRINVGFGGAVNQGIGKSLAPFVATLNDDAVAHPDWIAALLRAGASHPDAGMWASRVQLQGRDELDSAGMLICADASSTQRGHGEPASRYTSNGEALFPSGSAALYRRSMLAEIGGFDADFFLYCEDTDLGLRAQWAGWRCMYVADAIVDHRYSHSAGRASALKAYYVERNRLWAALKNFPSSWLLAAPFVTLIRYLWHVAFLVRGRGKAAQFEGGGAKLAWFVLRAHLATAVVLPALLAKRREVQKKARVSAREFAAVLRRHSVGVREVAAH